MTELADGLTEKRLREALEFYAQYETWVGNAPDRPMPRIKADADDDGSIPGNKARAALALPKSQAEKEISEIARRIRGAENQIQWCYDMLGKKRLTGNEEATVRITLRETLKDLKACREAGLE